MGTVIERIDFDSAQLPPARQFDSWACHAPYARLTALNPGPFRARGSLWKLHEGHITTAELDPFCTERDDQLIERVEADQIHIVVLLRGSIRFEADGIDEVCVAPDVCVRDLTLPSRITAGPIECMTIYFTRDFLARAGGVVGRHGRLPSSPELAVACELLRSLVAQLPDIGIDSGAYYARALRDLIAAAIIAGWGPASKRPAGTAASRIKNYIAAQPPGTLDVAAMTLALGISRAALYRLFRREGGIIAYDRQTQSMFVLPFSRTRTHSVAMPIRAENRWLYPIDWQQLSCLVRFERAGDRCERCRRPHRRHVAHLGDGRWWDADARCWRSDFGRRVATRGCRCSPPCA